MRHISLACGLAVLTLTTLACAGSPEPASDAPQPVEATPEPSLDDSAAQAVTIWLSGKTSQTPELIDTSPDGRYVALRILTARDDESQDVARCDYPALADDVDGVELALVDFEAQSVQQWTVYETPSSHDASCTDEAAAVAELSVAKEAMQAVGLDPSLRQSWLPPRPFEAGPDQTARPRVESRAIELASGEVLSIGLEHTSDSGYHTYTARVSGANANAVATHAPNPGMGGSGDLEVRGAAATEGGTVVLFEARHGPVGMWSSWMLTPPL